VHASQELLALTFWIWPGGHAWQYEAASWLTAPEPNRPGSHASQKKALAVALYFPAGHALHISAFSSSEYVPAKQSTQTPLPVTYVPGLQIPQ
jgi:hypothetical protein